MPRRLGFRLGPHASPCASIPATVALVAAIATAGALSGAGAAPQDSQEETVQQEAPPRSVRVAADLVLVIAPPSGLFPQAAADPRRAGSGLMYAFVRDSDIPDTGDRRFILRLGGRIGLLRLSRLAHPERGLQLDFEGGFIGHFDIERGYDAIGWDGIYGLTLSWRPNATLNLRLGSMHDSAHVGDEYGERTGRRRIHYTREEWIVGASKFIAPGWRVYSEAGYAYTLRNLQKPWRLQLGTERRGPPILWRNQMRWFVAADLTATEERDWKATAVIQLGVELARGRDGGTFRLGVEYLEGRSVLGEFFQHDESYLGLGLWFDF